MTIIPYMKTNYKRSLRNMKCDGGGILTILFFITMLKLLKKQNLKKNTEVLYV